MNPRTFLKDLEKALAARDWDAASDNCFRTMYCLSGVFQLKIAVKIVGRYLPVFQSRCPTVTWPKDILENLALWVATNDRSIPEHETDHPGDSHFLSSLDGLVLAQAYRANPLILTSSCVCAIENEIAARMDNVWFADDPEAYAVMKATYWSETGELDIREYQEGVKEFQGRSVCESAPALAVRDREWSIVLSSIKAHVGKPSRQKRDKEAMERDLMTWRRRGGYLIVPELDEQEQP
jgi:hypothetical protein